jgi:glycosyltransferase involved in cell wall biosynthesis
MSADKKEVRQIQQDNARARYHNFLEMFSEFWSGVRAILGSKTKVPMPPLLLPQDCPPISIVTLLYNRRKFFYLACHNIMMSDYPKDKIEWLIVEDSDDPNENASDRVIQVGLKAAPLTLAYVPLERKTPISEKRNLGVKRAKNDIILFMDDDDHYPETSFRRRVAWLTKHPLQPQAAVCTTIACYDLIRGVSAVNTPPWNLPLRKRISEATLTFYKSWWQTKKFTFGVNISEGEGFLEGREHEVIEMPPQQIIVAFNHKKNISGRRIPAADAKPGCFWGFPKEYLIYIHKLAGVEVEEEKDKEKTRS